MPSPRLDRAAFERRFRARFADPAFAPLAGEIDRLARRAKAVELAGWAYPRHLAGRRFAVVGAARRAGRPGAGQRSCSARRTPRPQ